MGVEDHLTGVAHQVVQAELQRGLVQMPKPPFYPRKTTMMEVEIINRGKCSFF